MLPAHERAALRALMNHLMSHVTSELLETAR
jgi:hypothetical protein